jgi:hypothetical protein
MNGDELFKIRPVNEEQNDFIITIGQHLGNDGKARMSIRDFSESLTSNESHGYVCTRIYELSY